MIVTHRASNTTGRLVRIAGNDVHIRSFTGADAVFTNIPGAFIIDKRQSHLVAVPAQPSERPEKQVTASGSIAARDASARVATTSRIVVEGNHDAELIERVWGDDLRSEGVPVEILGGLDRLPGLIRNFDPAPDRHLGVLADHLIEGTKESRIAAQINNRYVLITGHPYVDVWEAIKPRTIGISEWPQIPKGTDWKSGICELLGKNPRTFWPEVLGSVNSYRDLETPLINAVERLIDFVTEPAPA